MHDNASDFLRRTTNVKKSFPDTDFSHSTNLTWEELQTLNAGEWFVQVSARPNTCTRTIVCNNHTASNGDKLLTYGLSAFQTDPFRSVSQLSNEEKETAKNQTIPSLLQLLNLAKDHNVSVMFDLYSPNPENDTVDTVSTILSSGIDPRLVSQMQISVMGTFQDVLTFPFL